MGSAESPWAEEENNGVRQTCDYNTAVKLPSTEERIVSPHSSDSWVADTRNTTESHTLQVSRTDWMLSKFGEMTDILCLNLENISKYFNQTT